jgi:hypothetical protein
MVASDSTHISGTNWRLLSACKRQRISSNAVKKSRSMALGATAYKEGYYFLTFPHHSGKDAVGSQVAS